MVGKADVKAVRGARAWGFQETAGRWEAEANEGWRGRQGGLCGPRQAGAWGLFQMQWETM